MEFLKKYPFNYEIKYLAANALYAFLYRSKIRNQYSIPDDEYERLHNEGIKILILMKNKDTDPSHQIWIRDFLMNYYSMNKEYDKAEATALELPEVGLIRDASVFNVECDKEDYDAMERHSEKITGEYGGYYLNFMFWRAESISKFGDIRKKEAIIAWADFERSAAEYSKTFFDSWLTAEDISDFGSPFMWHLEAITQMANSYLCLNDVESALDCLERAEKVGLERFNEAKKSGADKEKIDFILREIKMIPIYCYNCVIPNDDNFLSREERWKACKARFDALE